MENASLVEKPFLTVTNVQMPILVKHAMKMLHLFNLVSVLNVNMDGHLSQAVRSKTVNVKTM
jgi:hypothetical protein